ncbi:MAG: amino acid adenylation domain-containing protein, partial [Candidatus Aminicenantes bacterium]|nr:amino acid adenylation domain-containing protein [Candidatus Aminicenantes bacterium]
MIAKQFEEQVKKSPGCTAIKAGEGCLTYGELNRNANRVARLILKTLKNDEKPGRVSLLFDHGIDMIAAILGVLKAGKTYVPLSTDYPDNRLSYMVTNSESSMVLSLCEHEERARRIVQTADISCLPVNRDIECSAEAEVNPEMKITGSDLAYIMYTSGSTGRPKGVMQTHENVLYYIENWTRMFAITNADRLTLFSSFCHDGSVQDMLGALLNGATLYPVNVRDRQDSFELSEFLIRERITIWHSVHSLFAYFANSLSGTEDFKALSRILLGGEPIRAHEIELFKKFFPHAVLANVYGQTESSVNSTWLIHPEDNIEHMTIGEPLDRTQILALDRDNTEVDEFEVGEIIIACPHLSPGYWKDEVSSQNTFKGSEELGPIYFTGDLGRLLPDGQIEFMGRRDSQVKLRGFRIELGEIESQLLKHPQIHEAVVTMRELNLTGNAGKAGQDEGSGDTYLCAYIVVKNGAQRVQPL